MFLQEFGDHANIIKLHNVLKAENDKDIYLVFEFMGKCLHKVRTWVLTEKSDAISNSNGRRTFAFVCVRSP